MARPKKEGLEYFPHDTFTDDKIEAMEARYGLAGHAFYFKLCERIYRTIDGELDVSDAETIQILSRNWHISRNRFSEMLSTALKIGLFDRELFEKTKRLSSNGIKKRRNSVNAKRIAMRENYIQSKLKQGISDAETREETTPETPQSKVKESKVNTTTTGTGENPEKNKKTSKGQPGLGNQNDVDRSDAGKSTEPGLDNVGEQDPNLTAIVLCYEQNLGMINPSIAEELKDIAKEYPVEWFPEAVKEASKNNVRKLNYVISILERWQNEGFKTQHKPVLFDPIKKGVSSGTSQRYPETYKPHHTTDEERVRGAL